MKLFCDKIFWILVLTLSTTAAQQSCLTPDNKRGRCVSSQQCAQEVLNQIKENYSVDSWVTELSKWVCYGISNEPSFCCDDTLLEKKRLDNLYPTSDIKLYGGNSPNGYESSLSAQGLNKLKSTKCGYADSGRVAHGVNAGLYEFPWMALIRYNTPDKPFKCGGTLITDEYVLTAAHCIDVAELEIVGVRLGEYDVNSEKDCLGRPPVCAPPVEDYGIAKTIAHPEYNINRRTNDVGLIKLDRKVKFKQHISPICLPINERNTHIATDQDFVIAGWGYTETGSTANILQKAYVKYQSRPSCRQIFRRTRIDDNHICAGGETPSDSCKGDSGGPLLVLTKYNGSTRYVQLGVVSFGNVECGSNLAIPGIYSNLAHFMPWITQNIN